MNEKYSCVLDRESYYKEFVIQVLRQQMDGTEEWEVQYYIPAEGERLVDANSPVMRLYAGADGFVRPRWDDSALAWVEGATMKEIATWELEHPAPESPSKLPTLEERTSAIELAMLELLGGVANV